MRKRGISGVSGYQQTQQRVPDFRRYEIKDHLGNVRTVIADYKNPFNPSGQVIDWKYLANVKNISNMYPYGKSYGANATYDRTDDYRYGFNGMEKEKNFSETGDITDFGARFLDSEFPTFGKPDPLEASFSYKSPYIMATNNPIWAIDVDGETSFFVFGTKHVPETNELSTLRASVDYIHHKISASTGPIDYGFNWSNLNGQWNTVKDRVDAAKLLAEYAYDNNKKGDVITFIGYSYGGAVAVIAADILFKKYGVKVNIISIATPSNNKDMGYKFTMEFYNADYGVIASLVDRYYGMGNPDNSEGINEMLHFYLDEDGIAGGVYDDYYDSPKVKNYVLNTKEASWNENAGFFDFFTKWIDSHTDILFNPNVFYKTIKNNGIGKQSKPTPKGGNDGNSGKKTK